ncbi:uncharacterized protein AB675_4723 [Cyphellophora attinorum]|uniref:Uncharacterized protein n=1 Tax=Cyphellophora attinorum TaxID=1664694 RepID=A0A0N1HNC8_9EURO|nr:uncharacterized protein AB675_4723 [Phialophora attinorum]KPI38985.1 hypothetical protein AB675_4723 [Phialophora attinorum]
MARTKQIARKGRGGAASRRRLGTQTATTEALRGSLFGDANEPQPKFHVGDKVYLNGVLPAHTKTDFEIVWFNITDGVCEYRLEGSLSPGSKTKIVVSEEKVYQLAYPIGTELEFHGKGPLSVVRDKVKVTDWKLRNGEVVYDVDVGQVSQVHTVGTSFGLKLRGLGLLGAELRHVFTPHKSESAGHVQLDWNVGVHQISEAQLVAEQEPMKMLGGAAPNDVEAEDSA